MPTLPMPSMPPDKAYRIIRRAAAMSSAAGSAPGMKRDRIDVAERS